MTEQVLDVRGSARLIRRSWRLVAALTVVGAAAVGTYEVAQPPQYHASALVLLPQVPGGSGNASATSTSSSHGSTTDVQIALSAAVLMPAARSVGLSLPLRSMQQRVSAAQAAPNIVHITAKGATATQSERLANAVANQLVDFFTASGASSTSGAVVGLETEATRLKSQIANVKKDLSSVQQRIANEGASSPAGKQDTALASQLAASQSALGLQLSSVNNQITEAQLGQVSAAQGTEVIQKATTATLPSKSSLILPIVLGALGGLLVGSVFVVARKRSDPRLRTRDALAKALGAPVVLALDVKARRTSGDWSELFERHQPRASDRWAVRKALRELGVDESSGTLEVLCFGEDRAAIALAAEVSVAATASGFPASFSVVAAGADAPPLRAICARFDNDSQSPRAGLLLRDAGHGHPDSDSELSVVAVLLDRDHPDRNAVTHRRGATTVLATSAGSASADQLASAAITTADAGGPISGILLANPSPDDQTVGRPPRGNAGTPLIALRSTIHSSAGRQR